MTSWSQGNSFTAVPGLPFSSIQQSAHKFDSAVRAEDDQNDRKMLLHTNGA
jgi:hypothetical protein